MRIDGPRFSVWRATGPVYQRQIDSNAAGCVAWVEVHHNAAADPKIDYALAIVAANASETSKHWGHLFTELVAQEFGSRAARLSIGPKRGSFNLKFLKMPAILTEAGFVSNADFAARIRTGEGIDAEARCLVQSILNHFPDGGLIGLSVGHGDRGKPDPGALVNEGELHDPAFDTEEEINRAVVEATAEMLLRVPARDTEPAPSPESAA